MNYAGKYRHDKQVETVDTGKPGNRALNLSGASKQSNIYS